MYLKSVEMQGFKSFADKIYIDFNPGITAIVGPNGSGKSNISDAIRWVMGEQSVKSLRGSKMEDVIFAGTETRKPLGFAEVSLTLDNSKKIFNVEYEEVTVSRRVYRSGESEYSINKTPCRLKDIHELFMDTGLGREGYSVIGQGKIDEILSNKSEDRRYIFEEAAGITKYKYRKAEAEKKLNNTTENLIRVYDILNELEVQLEPLRFQSENAKKYLNLREELKALDVKVSVLNIKKSKTELNETEKICSALSFDLEVIQNNIDLFEKRINEMYDELSDLEKLTEELREEEKKNIFSVGDYANRINVLRANAEHEKENIERVKSDIEKSSVSRKYLDEMLSQHDEKIKAFEIDREKLNAEQERLNIEFDESLNLYETHVKSLDDLNNEITKKNNDIITGKEKISAAESMISAYKTRKKSLLEELKYKDDNFIEFSEKFKVLESNKISKEKELIDARKSFDEENLKFNKLNESLKELADDKQKMVSIKEHKLSKKSVLEELENDFEGYGKSVKAVMNAYNSKSFKGATLFGPLSQLIHTDKKYVTAIDVALQNSGQNIVTETEEDAKIAIEFLKKTNSGRATFLPISAVKPRKIETEEYSSLKGYIANAAELISCEDKYRDIVSSVLGGTIVVDNIDNGVLIAKKTKYKMMIATLQGELIRAGGAITGGSFSKSSGFLSRLSEIEELEKEIKKIENKISLIEKDYNELSEKSVHILEEKTLISNRLSALNEEFIRLSSDYENQKAFYETLKNSKENFEKEIAELDADIKFAESTASECEKIISDAEDFLKSYENEINKLNDDISKAEEKTEKIREQITNINIALSNIEKDIEHSRERKNDISVQRDNALTVNKEREEEIKSYLAKIEEINKQIESFEEARKTLSHNSKIANEKIEELVGRNKAINEEIRKKQEQAKETREQFFAVSQQKTKLESKKARLETELDTVFDRLYEDYEITFSDAEKYFEEGENINVAASQKRINVLKSEIKNLGNINIDAIEGYKTVKERFDFLTAQTDDLEKSKKELMAIIDELMHDMKKQFREQFTVINKNFNSVFKELFGGGTAKLELSDPENLLESGIEIEAQPPGKKLQSLTLLSGGERAFTAIALLFAILNVRPTPFCILDEIEAALDDVNVYRFADYLKNYSKKTQFIVVTHRRGTMEAANMLYGVTMQERGISKMISLNIDEVTN